LFWKISYEKNKKFTLAIICQEETKLKSVLQSLQGLQHFKLAGNKWIITIPEI